jgi:hypothetical protein
MKTATVHELKDELQHLPPAKVLDLCVRLAKFKKENKELLTYLLFEAHNEPGYTTEVKQQMDEAFTAINTSQVYLAKKTLRKTLRIANKHIKYMGSKQAEVELLIHFCTLMQSSGLPIKKHKVLTNLYQTQLARIEKSLSGLHEDIQYDYKRTVKTLPL